MVAVESSSHDPYYNAAFEEYMMTCFQGEACLLLWVNDPCLVCGRYQNVYEEINVPEAERRKIPVIRRNTGGGTVYHDRGNLNYTVIRRRAPEANFEYDSFLTPVIEALRTIGAPVRKRNTCDIAVGDLKISGSAQSVKKDRILHHGTLLFDADLTELRGLLTPSEGIFRSKAVKSVRSEVTNIRPHLQKDMDFDGFRHAFRDALLKGETVPETVGPAGELEIRRLAREKYETWEWNFGKSPDFTFRRTAQAAGLPFTVELCVSRGIVVKCSIEWETPECGALAESVVGLRYSYLDLRSVTELADLFF